MHARYTGTGHADTTKYEFVTHQHRDTLAGIVGHPPLLSYLSIADGECQARERFEIIEVRTRWIQSDNSACCSHVDSPRERLMTRREVELEACWVVVQYKWQSLQGILHPGQCPL